MLEATIVRSLGIGRVQSVALQFDVRRQTMPLSA
jgi:DNA topoisomerase IA